ncbi:hypothetical protein BD413DRAFT_550607 [Trametes elegans]|nr:hypothetical protein BD413DRAFT_550607 [Trametes elegans]
MTTYGDYTNQPFAVRRVDTSAPSWPLATHPDGSPNPGGIPEWLKNHRELKRRGVELVATLKPSFVFCTDIGNETIPAFAVKLMEADTEEAAIYRRLAQDPKPANHTVPFEIIDNEEPSLLVMPFLVSLGLAVTFASPLSRLLGVFIQVVEGVEYLHSQRIVHLDVCYSNTLFAFEINSALDERVVAGRVYIIDFHSSKQLSLGPGVQTAIPLPPTQVLPPLNMTHFDPYSWDVYCLGDVWRHIVNAKYYDGTPPPAITHWITRWVKGEERGCTTVCHCRPTARRVRQVLSVVWWVVHAGERCSQILDDTLIFLKLRPAREPEMTPAFT